MILKVGSYNILHGEDYPRRLQTGERSLDLDKVAATIRSLNVDLCGLNEVRNQQGDGLCHQGEAIAKRLGWNMVFAPAIAIDRGTYGNALISRFPIRSVRTIPIQTTQKERLPGGRYEDRVLLIAEIDADGTPLTAMVCHFGLNGIEADRATETVLNEVKKITSPLLFMGDLNLTPDDRRIQALAATLNDTAQRSDESLLSFPADNPERKIDYIFTNDCFKTLRVEVPNVGNSDHRPIRAEIEL